MKRAIRIRPWMQGSFLKEIEKVNFILCNEEEMFSALESHGVDLVFGVSFVALIDEPLHLFVFYEDCSRNAVRKTFLLPIVDCWGDEIQVETTILPVNPVKLGLESDWTNYSPFFNVEYGLNDWIIWNESVVNGRRRSETKEEKNKEIKEYALGLDAGSILSILGYKNINPLNYKRLEVKNNFLRSYEEQYYADYTKRERIQDSLWMTPEEFDQAEQARAKEEARTRKIESEYKDITQKEIQARIKERLKNLAELKEKGSPNGIPNPQLDD